MRDAPAGLMLFAAGLGTRMGALTAHQPKPLIRVAGRALLDHALDVADAMPLARKVINLHYLPDRIEAHLAHRRDIAFSREPGVLLDTGGGLKAALPMFGTRPVFTLNTDAVWTGENPLRQLATAWDGARMDCLLLLLPLAAVRAHTGAGDFTMDAAGRLRRGAGAQSLVYLGAQIVSPALVSAVPDRVFSMNRVWDAAIERGRLHGVVHQGGWCDVGHPEGIAEAEAMLQARP
jgi:N-acetyl-alpha-D-muramate 1-phosphate uridylyltransferase